MALSLVAFLTMLGQLLVQSTLNSGLHDSWLVNFAGRQRFQSQLIAKSALLLTERPELVDKQTHLAELKRVLHDWEDHHEQLKTGNLRDIHATATNSDAVRAMFVDIEPHFQVIAKNAHSIIRWLEQSNPTGNVNTELKNIFSHELIFLRKMNQIVFQYDQEAKAKVTSLSRIELWLMVFTLGVLIVEGLFIFRPAVQKLKETLHQLIEARENANQVNKELKSAYEQLRITQAQLLEATQLRHRQELKEQKIHTSALLQGQEQERRRLSKELHDGVGQMLTGLKMMTESLANGVSWSEADRTKVGNLGQLVGQTIQEVRNISNNLMPSVLNDFGVKAALKQLVDSTIRNTGAPLIFESNFKDKRFDERLEIGLYRIAQEAIHNAVKHAQATEIIVQLLEQDKSIVLRIKDNGKGFRANKKASASLVPSHGLTNLQERTRLLDGKIKIQSSMGQGTEVIVTIPQLN